MARKARRIENARFQAEAVGLVHGLPASQDAIPGPLPPEKRSGAVRTPVRGKAGKRKKRPKARKIKRGALKSQIVRLLGLLDAKKNGPACRFHGDHPGDTSCHIVPQQRGDAARFVPENIYWGCRGANYGEFRHRSLYRDHHIRIFGKDLVERLEAVAREFRQYSMAELLGLRETLKTELGAA